jgi:hypothetical protein
MYPLAGLGNHFVEEYKREGKRSRKRIWGGFV